MNTMLIYTSHTKVATCAGMNPIYNMFEWYPNKYYYENIPGLNASNEYKYVCAIQRNEKLAQLVQMDMNELIRFRNKGEADKFHKLFDNAMSEVVASPDQFNEIAEIVFTKLNETLCSVNQDRKKIYSKNIVSSIIGFCKAIGGFVPILSQVLGSADVVSSGYNVYKAISGENDVIRYLIKKEDNIFAND